MLLKRSLRSSTPLFSRRVKNLLPRLIPILVLILCLFGFNYLFSIKKLDCRLGSDSCPQEVLTNLNKYLNQNILFVNQKSLLTTIKNQIPGAEIKVGFKLFNTLTISIQGKFNHLEIQTTLLAKPLVLGLDQLTGSTISGSWQKPSLELAPILSTQNFVNFTLWDDGSLTPTASGEAKVKFILSVKPEADKLKNFYALYQLVEKYLSAEQILVLDNTVFLSRSGEPDIIVNIPFEEDTLVQALQSYPYLSTIKKDAKVIDLRFKNPIIR